MLANRTNFEEPINLWGGMTVCPSTCKKILFVSFQGALVIQTDMMSLDREVAWHYH